MDGVYVLLTEEHMDAFEDTEETETDTLLT